MPPVSKPIGSLHVLCRSLLLMCTCAVQMRGELPMAGFPIIASLGRFQFPNNLYTGHLFELRGQPFRRMERNFPPPRDARRLSTPAPLAVPLPAAFGTHLRLRNTQGTSAGGVATMLNQISWSNSVPETSPEGVPTLVCCYCKLEVSAAGQVRGRDSSARVTSVAALSQPCTSSVNSLCLLASSWVPTSS
jgi:hypothetical protein